MAPRFLAGCLCLAQLPPPPMPSGPTALPAVIGTFCPMLPTMAAADDRPRGSGSGWCGRGPQLRISFYVIGLK